MDWLDDLFDKLRLYIKSVSLRKAMSMYILFAMISLFFVWFSTNHFCEGWKNLVVSKYNINFESYVPIEYLDIEEYDKKLLKLIDFIDKYSIFIYSMITVMITSNFYYNNKIKEPLNILKTEAEYVSRGDLSFECRYESNDEMGTICKTFNDMRLSLIENNKNMWSLIEEQSHLNAILSHDLRNPLSIIEGYNEMLIKYLPEGKISEYKLYDTLNSMNKQILRMKEFLERIKSIRSISEMKVNKEERNISDLVKSIEEMVKGTKISEDINIHIENYAKNKACFYDLSIIEETVGNMLSNALRFAKSEIIITLKLERDKLCIFVRDDGEGFSQKGLYKALEPFYSTDKNNESHFGIGLNVCKILTEKHGGSLSVSNSIDGGAIVCADFFVM